MTLSKFTATTAELCRALGVGETTLRRLREEGVLVAGKHFRHIGVGRVRPRLRWSIADVDEALTHRSRRLKVGAA